MDIRYVSSDQDRQTNLVLAAVAERAASEGIRLAGTVQPVMGDVPQQKCEIVLRLLPDGPIRNISLDLGPGATGCRLDAGALEQAVLEVQDRMAGAQGLIVNKFGKQEAEGRGMAPLIADALERNLPVLLGVNGLNLPAFQTFAGGLETALAADIDQVVEWCVSAGYHLHEPAR